jgi:hypothetical protein
MMDFPALAVLALLESFLERLGGAHVSSAGRRR